MPFKYKLKTDRGDQYSYIVYSNDPLSPMPKQTSGAHLGDRHIHTTTLWAPVETNMTQQKHLQWIKERVELYLFNQLCRCDGVEWSVTITDAGVMTNPARNKSFDLLCIRVCIAEPSSVEFPDRPARDDAMTISARLGSSLAADFQVAQWITESEFYVFVADEVKAIFTNGYNIFHDYVDNVGEWKNG